MRIAVFGSGGVGGYFGGRLVQAGEDVIFIARGAHLLAMQSSGLRIQSINGNLRLQTVQASDDPHQVGPVDLILLAVKAWQAPEAIEALRPMVGEGTGVVPLGNGVDTPEQLVNALGVEHALGGLCRISAFLAAPGLIKHVGIDPIVVIGELDNRRSARVEALQDAFTRAGVTVTVSKDIQAAMWEKFIFIAAISGVGAVTRSPAGVIRNLPGVRRILEGVIDEIVQVARQRRVNLPKDISSKILAVIDNLPYENLASMQRDIMEGRPSELEAQNGAVVRMAAEAGISTPFNQFIYDCLLPQELKARGEL